MNWIQATIFTSADGIEPVTGRLYRLGVVGAEIEDGNELREFLKENRSRWDYVDESVEKKLSGETCVKIYLEDGEEGRQTLAAAKQSMSELKALDSDGKFGRLSIELSGMSEDDWANGWKKYFKPLRVGEKILICPEWEKVPDGSDGLTVFKVDPGMTFGTGAHETTRLCITELERLIKPGTRMLDLGCGSGILSVISILLGAASASAVDIDPASREAAARNARLNGVDADKLRVFIGDLVGDNKLREQLGKGCYDVIAANIVADVIIALAPAVPALLAEDGTFLCSGIIDERSDEVAAALAASGLRALRTAQDNGWVAMTCKLK
jgi:ribosomal protein L11 methyltransferase